MGERTADANLVLTEMTTFKATLAQLLTDHKIDPQTQEVRFPGDFKFIWDAATPENDSFIKEIEDACDWILTHEDHVELGPFTGQHTGSNGQESLRDSAQPFPNGDLEAGYYRVVNQTTGADAFIFNNTRRRIDAEMMGGERPTGELDEEGNPITESDDFWNRDDNYRVAFRANRLNRLLRRNSATAIKTIRKIRQELSNIREGFGYTPGGEGGQQVYDQALLDDFQAARQSLNAARDAARNMRRAGRS